MIVIENKYERHDPNIHEPILRCEGMVLNGQCPFNKAEGTNYCPMHGHNKSEIHIQNEIKRNYQLRRFKERIYALADSEQIKSLREEIGILRMCVEETINRCEDATDILMASHRISDLIIKIEKLVVSCDKLEGRMGLLLSKRAIIQLAGEFVQIISVHIDDPNVIESISEKMLESTRRIETIAEE